MPNISIKYYNSSRHWLYTPYLIINIKNTLVFDYSPAANELIGSLSADPEIESIYIYTVEGHLFASYHKKDYTTFVYVY